MDVCSLLKCDKRSVASIPLPEGTRYEMCRRHYDFYLRNREQKTYNQIELERLFVIINSNDKGEE